MRRIAIISINGIAIMGGVERVVADHQRILSEVAYVRVFSLPRYESIRRFRLANALLSICFTSMSGAIARVWAGPHGIVISAFLGWRASARAISSTCGPWRRRGRTRR
jgi:hypothetical protein